MFNNNKLLLGINNILQWLKRTMPLGILCQDRRNETTPNSLFMYPVLHFITKKYKYLIKLSMTVLRGLYYE